MAQNKKLNFGNVNALFKIFLGTPPKVENCDPPKCPRMGLNPAPIHGLGKNLGNVICILNTLLGFSPTLENCDHPGCPRMGLNPVFIHGLKLEPSVSHFGAPQEMDHCNPRCPKMDFKLPQGHGFPKPNTPEHWDIRLTINWEGVWKGEMCSKIEVQTPCFGSSC